MVLLIGPVFAFAQKKPNVNKAMTLMQAGNLAEAKAMIDAATVYEKTKDDAKTWYYHGLIYIALDTTSNPEYAGLASNAVETAVKSFEKADQLNAGKGELFLTTNGSFVTKFQQLEYFSNYYLNEGATAYQEDDSQKAYESFVKSVKLNPDDTLNVYYAALISSELEKYDETIQYLNDYIERGGTSPDAYRLLLSIYVSAKNDKEKALSIAQQAKAKFPDLAEFARSEVSLLLELGRIDEAKEGLIKEVAADPDNAALHFFLAYVYLQQEDYVNAKKQFEETLRIEPNNFDAQYYVARLESARAEELRTQMNALGISKEDMKKKLEIDKQYVAELKRVIPFWEKAEALYTEESDKDQMGVILDELSQMYGDIDNTAGVNRVRQKYKQLGLEE